MHRSHQLTRRSWPDHDIPDSVFAYFVRIQFIKYPQYKVFIRNRHNFLATLQKGGIFKELWDHIQEMHPQKKPYFEALLDCQKRFQADWIEKEYHWYLFGKDFNEMGDDEKRSVEAKFEAIRLKAYQVALEGEAIRLNCPVSEVRPHCPVLPWVSNGNETSRLTDLPDAIFLNIMNRLDTLDIFRTTLVCEKWKDLVYDSPRVLRRVEHARTTHVITFTDWMDPARTPSPKTFKRQYRQFSFCLARWCCGISNYLETLILDHPVPYSSMATLLQSCPNLKNLQLGLNSAPQNFIPGNLFPEVSLPNLEVYLCNELHVNVQSQELITNILCSVKQLRVLRASVLDKDLEAVQLKRPVTDVFCHLIALDLTHFTDRPLQTLATVPNLQLRYLRLGEIYIKNALNATEYETTTARYRDAFHQFLPRLKKLEVLETWFVPGVTNETIQLLIDLDLNLQFAVLAHSFVTIDDMQAFSKPEIPADPLDPYLLTEFRDRLLLRNPELDLSDFQFIVAGPEARDQLLALDIGFTFVHRGTHISREFTISGLRCPSMRNRLNINF